MTLSVDSLTRYRDLNWELFSLRILMILLHQTLAFVASRRHTLPPKLLFTFVIYLFFLFLELFFFVFEIRNSVTVHLGFCFVFKLSISELTEFLNLNIHLFCLLVMYFRKSFLLDLYFGKSSTIISFNESKFSLLFL